MGDEITLTLPRVRPFYRVVHLVVGGLAVRLDLTVETLEDLQLALDGLLDHDEGPDTVTVALRLADGSILTRVGPFQPDAIRSAFDAEGLGLRRILETVADSVRVDGEWVELTKAIQPVEQSA